MKWQPIETAPTNDEEMPIIIHGKNGVDIAVWVHPSKKHTFMTSQGIIKPQFWLPIPPLPDEVAKKD